MYRFRCNQKQLDKWMHQNRAVYAGDFVEGCLLDNFMLACKRGFAAVYERYVNPGKSAYEVEFELGPAQSVWARWYAFEDAATKVST